MILSIFFSFVLNMFFFIKVSPFDLQRKLSHLKLFECSELFSYMNSHLPTKNHLPQKLYYSIHDEHNGDSERSMAS